MYRWERKRTATERRVQYLDWLLTSPYSAKEVRLFGLGTLFMSWYRGLRQQLIRERVRISSRRCLWESTAELSAVLAIFGSYAFVAYRALEGAVTIANEE